MASNDNAIVERVYGLLSSHRNVLVSGAPGTGKSRLLAAVRRAFVVPAATSGPILQPGQPVALPRSSPILPPSSALLQGLSEAKVFSTTFDQNTKHSDFLRGIVPQIGSGMNFRVSRGVLYEAAEFAAKPGQAALLVIDEINRGPAVTVFGTSMVALEPSKRLDSSGNEGPESQSFLLLDDAGDPAPYFLPDRLFIVAAMNQADTSVEPMDVAFLRRFARVALNPDAEVVRTNLGVPSGHTPTPGSPSSTDDVYTALFLAWQSINKRIHRGKGEAFQMGHGLLLRTPPSSDLATSVRETEDTWALMFAHLSEIFYGDPRGLGEALGAETANSVYEIDETLFGDQQVAILQLKKSDASVYEILLAAVE